MEGGDNLRINFGNWSINFGRKPKEPTRNTYENYYSVLPFISVMRQRQPMPKPNAQTLRNFSENTVVRMVLNIIIDGLIRRQWRLVDTNGSDNVEAKAIVTEILKNPNGDDDYDSFFTAILEDSLVGDCMCFEKAKGGNPQKPLFLFPIDGMTMDVVIGDTQWKYSQMQNGERKFYDSSLVAYIKRRSRTNTPFGLSPLETSFQYIAALTNTFGYSSEVASNALPKYALNLVGGSAGQKLDEVRNYFVNDCMGEVSIPILNADKMESAQIAPISEDATFMKYQSFLMAIISHEFGVPGELIGVEKANDKSTTQDKQLELIENALKPYARLLEKAINKHVIEALGYPLRFEIIWEETLKDKQMKSEMISNQYQQDIITLNEARAALGLPQLDEEWSNDRITVYKAKVNEKYGINGFGNAKDPTKGGD